MRHLSLSGIRKDLSEQAGTAGLNGLNLSLGPRKTVEASRKLVAVEKFTVLRLNGTQRGTRAAANALRERGTAKRAVLLSLDTVGGEGVREDSGRRSGVRTGGVVNGLCRWSC